MKIIIRKLNTARKLSLNNWLILCKGWFLMFYIRVRMNLTPFKSWKHWLEMQQNEPLGELTEADKTKIKNYHQLIVLASRHHLVKANCLPKSLALKWLLASENIQSQLKLGLNATDNSFHGHAWLVHNERVLNDSRDVARQYPIQQELTQKPLIN